MKKSLIVIDYQNDFVCDNGALTLGKVAQNLEPIILEKIDTYLQNNQTIFFTLDTHFEKNWNNHPESNSYNLHCQKDTFGSQLYSAIKQKANNKNCICLEKNTFCLKDEHLTKIITESDEIEIVGLVTHICVFQIAIGLYNKAVELSKNVKFVLCQKGCADFDKDKHNFAIDYLKTVLGFTIV